MADQKNQPGTEGSSSVSALGLRWAALRGMLGSPLIEVDEQRPLRDELVRELHLIERNFAAIAARNATEISAKIDVAKAALRQGSLDMDGWIVELLESVQTDLRAVGQSNGPRYERSPVNLTRTTPARVDQSPAADVDEEDQAAVA
jgi:hypothetical protein